MTTSETTPLLGKPQVGLNRELSIAEAEKEFSFGSVSRRKKFILISMAFVNFCACCCFSLLAPFFPIEAGKKGASQTIVGFIFGIFELIIFLSSPIFGNYLSKIGCKFMFVSGVMVCGSCAILFGLLDKCPNGTIFIVMCFLSRSVEALGCSAFVTALFAILAHEFPSSVITVMGLLETFSGLGMMVGPAIGGALYELGGYGLPFFVMGSLVIICGTITAFVMPPISGGESLYKGSVFTLLKSGLAVVTLLAIICASISLGYLDPTLAGHFEQFKLKTWVVGMLFLIAPAVYAVTAPLWGYLGDKKGYVRTMIAVGSIGGIFAMLALGPCPLLTFIPNALYVDIISLVFVGLFVGCCLIPTFKALLIGANSIGMPNNLDTYGKVSGFFNSCFSLGAFLGPTIGGSLVDRFGFPWGATVIAGLFLFSGLLMIIHGVCVPVIQVPEEAKTTEVSTSEKTLENDTTMATSVNV